jgi:hypothetical protein
MARCILRQRTKIRTQNTLTLISDFCRDVDEICAFLLDFCPLKMGPICCPETSVKNHHTTPHNIQKSAHLKDTLVFPSDLHHQWRVQDNLNMQWRNSTHVRKTLGNFHLFFLNCWLKVSMHSKTPTIATSTWVCLVLLCLPANAKTVRMFQVPTLCLSRSLPRLNSSKLSRLL